MLGNYLIGLREGLEATLVVSILVAYLVKTGNRAALGRIWLGVGAAIAASLAFVGLLALTSQTLDYQALELFEGVTSLAAVALVTWMIFWMRRTARFIKRDLEGRLETALTLGPAALAVIAFVAVAREGLETALFLFAAVRSTGETATPVAGAVLGLATAVGLGWLLYRGAVRINLAKFFTWTGAGLIVVAAGVLRYGVHDLQEAGVLPGLGATAFDVSWAVPADSWYGVLLTGTVNFVPDPSWLEVAAWLAYVVPVMTLFLLPARRPTRPREAARPAAERATTR